MINNVFFTNDELALIRNAARKRGDKSQLSDEILELLYKKEWLRVTIPDYCNGLEWEFPKIIELYEATAYADSALGWVVNLGSGANLFSGFFEQSVAQSIFTENKVCCAGSGALTGKAIQNGQNGYLMSGYWKYASGSAHATHFTASAILYDSHQNVVLNKNNEPETCSFIVKREHVQIHHTWNVSGLQASSSHDFSIENCIIPSEQIFSLKSSSTYTPKALYHIPFLLFGMLSLSAALMGITLHFIELFDRDILTRTRLYLDETLADNSEFMQKYQQVTHELYQERQLFYKDIHQVWADINHNKPLQEIDEKNLLQRSKKIAELSFSVVTTLYRYCGMSVVFKDSEISQVCRDVFVASQHFLLSPLHKV